MTKQAITRLFVGSWVAVAAGLVLLGVAGGIAYADGAFVMNGPDVTGVKATPFAWAMIALAIVAGLVVVGALVAQFVAWIAAVINAAGLPDKTWLVVLLVTGLLSFGLIGMIIYLVVAPDSERPAIPAQRPQVPGARAA